jgi:hypothetical protein
METEKPIQGNAYRIMIKETINMDVTRWFDGLTLTPLENCGTLLTGAFSDQSALRGFLDQLWNLNFTVVSVEKVGNGFHRESDPE